MTFLQSTYEVRFLPRRREDCRLPVGTCKCPPPSLRVGILFLRLVALGLDLQSRVVIWTTGKNIWSYLTSCSGLNPFAMSQALYLGLFELDTYLYRNTHLQGSGFF